MYFTVLEQAKVEGDKEVNEEKQTDGNETVPEEQLPSELYSEIMHGVDDKKQKFSEQTEKLGLASELLSDSKPIFQALDEVVRSRQPDPVAEATFQYLHALNRQVKALDPLLNQVNLQCTNIVSNVGFIGDATASTVSFVKWPDNFVKPNIDSVRNKRQNFDDHEEYALMLDRIDPSLGETFRSIKSALFGSPHDSVRMAIEQARQAWDHLIRKLVSDEVVKKQPWWPHWSSDPKNKDPKKVTRAQRMRLAAETYVGDHNQRCVLIRGASRTNQVYMILQDLHTPGPLDEIKEKDALFEMISIIKKWIDSIDWRLLGRT